MKDGWLSKTIPAITAHRRARGPLGTQVETESYGEWLEEKHDDGRPPAPLRAGTGYHVMLVGQMSP